MAPWAPLAYLGCGLAFGAVLLCFAEGASRVPTSGGVAGFIDAAFGPYWGFLTGFALAGCAAMLWVGAQSTPTEAAAIAALIAVASLIYRLRRQKALASA